MNASNANKRLVFMALLLACLALVGCSGSALYSHLEEQQANQVMAALLGSGIKANKNLSADKKGWEVRISERSEEHTSELQSIMRSSYAVFCLKKKTTN